MPASSRSLLVPLLAFSLALVPACGDENDGDGTRTEPIVHPTRPLDIVLRVEHGRGLPAPWFEPPPLPAFTLYGDGRVVTVTRWVSSAGDSALPLLDEGAVTEEGMQAILHAAEGAGLLEGDRTFELEGWFDIPTSAITLGADGATHVTRVTGLGFADAEETVPQEEREARAAIGRFVEDLSHLGEWLPAGSFEELGSYRYEAMRVFVQSPEQEMAPAVPAELEWPLDAELATWGEPWIDPRVSCRVVGGRDLRTLVRAADDASVLTLWRDGRALFRVFFRPSLPNESGCE